jgi:hypothetical protein
MPDGIKCFRNIQKDTSAIYFGFEYSRDSVRNPEKLMSCVMVSTKAKLEVWNAVF